MATRRSQVQHNSEAVLPPLLTWVENIHREIHQNPCDDMVAKIIDDNYSLDLVFDEDATLQDFDAFKAFNGTFRQMYLALKIKDRKPVVFKRDPTGKGGVVGFATSWILEQKKDKKLVGGDTIEIFEVTWNPETCEPLGGRRLITKAFVAFGDPIPIVRPKGERKHQGSKIVSGRVAKRSTRSK